MTTFFSSDTHFGHARIISLCNRPFRDVEHMDEMLIKYWNDTVGPEDTVYHLGDVALGSWERWHNILTRLNGHKRLIVGNHDRVFGQNKQSMIERFGPLYAEWFECGWSLHDALVLGGRQFFLSHFPYEGDSHGEDRYAGDRLVDKGVPLIHGHTHSTDTLTYSAKGTPQMHVGVDAWGYRPVSETEILSLFREGEL